MRNFIGLIGLTTAPYNKMPQTEWFKQNAFSYSCGDWNSKIKEVKRCWLFGILPPFLLTEPSSPGLTAFSTCTGCPYPMGSLTVLDEDLFLSFNLNYTLKSAISKYGHFTSQDFNIRFLRIQISLNSTQN